MRYEELPVGSVGKDWYKLVCVSMETMRPDDLEGTCQLGDGILGGEWWGMRCWTFEENKEPDFEGIHLMVCG